MSQENVELARRVVDAVNRRDVATIDSLWSEETEFNSRLGASEGHVFRLRSRIESGRESPPEGLEGVQEIWMLLDRDSGKRLGITVYETEEEMRRGDEALNAMSPVDSDARRADVSFYEVALRETRD
jgi:hypothetical protein